MLQLQYELRQMFLEAVDEGLLILGESARKSIYFHLSNTYKLAREDIPNNPDAFAEDLRKIFGAGARTIEESIMKSLYKKLGMRYEAKKKNSFEDYLEDAIRIIQAEPLTNQLK